MPKIVSSVAASLRALAVTEGSKDGAVAAVEAVLLRCGDNSQLVVACVVNGNAKKLVDSGRFAVPREALSVLQLTSDEITAFVNGCEEHLDAVAARALVKVAFPSVVALVGDVRTSPAVAAAPLHNNVVAYATMAAVDSGVTLAVLDLDSGALTPVSEKASAPSDGIVGTVGYAAASWDASAMRQAVSFTGSRAASAAARLPACGIFVPAEGFSLAKAASALSEMVAAQSQSKTAVFWPPECAVPLCVPVDGTGRLQLHAALQLPNRPLFSCGREVNIGVGWAAAPSTSAPTVPRHGETWETRLVRSIHALLSSKKCLAQDDTEVVVVDGPYDYYHYRVDGFEDDGWGCAYRSLQSLLSWFQYAGLMAEPMPTVRRIQEILVAVDAEKQRMPKFVGSRTWIGSFEVMMVLQHFVPNVECAIKRMESGAELWESAEVKQLIAQHFRRSKCPIMIGGSNYAHSILGIEWSPASGAVQYLILDPHYSARTTDVKIALSKGWCGWKDPAKFFNEDSWYNMCIPHVASADFRL